jgi:hypothetical protein
MSQQVVAGQAQGPAVEGQEVPQDLETPQGYANLQASLEQGFLNVIARKNLVQKRISQWNSVTGNNVNQAQRNNVLRNNCIKLALQSVLAKANASEAGLGDYSVASAFSGAYSAATNWWSRKGGRKSRKGRKARRGRKTRR